MRSIYSQDSIAAAAAHSRAAATSPDRSRNRCATVTMMLAERIIRNDWSVEDEHFFESSRMNVWQTLEFLSGISLRRRYNYEGYSDIHNSIRTLTPSWRRDSFAEKNVSPSGDESGTGNKRSGSGSGSASSPAQAAASEKYAIQSADNGEASGTQGENANDGGSARRAGSGGGRKQSSAGTLVQRRKNSQARRKESRSGRNKSGMRHGKKKSRQPEFDSEYALSPADFEDLIKCTFNLPRISAALERLMGTNVVRLTDRNYMKELRERIDDDYRQNLLKRIRARELKEVERERILIIEGKTKVIPTELADDPIFVVDKKAETIITKSRAKLKTNREKNAERLKSQGLKWDRERQKYEAEESKRIQELRLRNREQKLLEDQYTEENATRGIDLLRIENEDWRPCELKLKAFLKEERARMKERSWRHPTPFMTDPKDILNIVNARKRFKETEKRIRQQLDDEYELQKAQKEAFALVEADQQLRLAGATSEDGGKPLTQEPTTDVGEEMAMVPRTLASDEASDLTSGESFDEGSTISLAKQRYAYQLQQELQKDVAEGLLISKDQYDHLRYEDAKIRQLRNAKDIRELYQLAEEIIIGDKLEIFDVDGEEEGEAEEE